MRAFVFRAVEWQRRRQVKVEAKRLLEVAEALGISTDEAAAGWPGTWAVAATFEAPELMARHERRMRELEERAKRMRRRWLAQHLARVEGAQSRIYGEDAHGSDRSALEYNA